MRAIIFDMDGVLTDSEPLICSSAVEYFRRLGYTVDPADFIPFVGAGESRYIGGVAEKHGIQIEIEDAKSKVYEIYLAKVESELQAFPGAAELVRLCKSHGLLVAVASSADAVKVRANLRRIGLPEEEWDAVLTAEDVERRKPFPDIFLEAARRLGVEPDECVVVEDAVNGVEAAKAAKMRCVAVATTFDASLLSRADVVRTTIADVTLDDLIGSPEGPRIPCTRRGAMNG